MVTLRRLTLLLRRFYTHNFAVIFIQTKDAIETLSIQDVEIVVKLLGSVSTNANLLILIPVLRVVRIKGRDVKNRVLLFSVVLLIQKSNLYYTLS